MNPPKVEINEERHHMNLGGLSMPDITVNRASNGAVLLAIDEDCIALRPGAAAALARWLNDLARVDRKDR